MAKSKQKLLIIDGNALVHRAFHALPPSLTDQTGRMTNAVYGFTMIFIKALKDLKPDYIAATFDLKAKTFRHEAFTEYKATRVKQPDELYEQIPLVKEVLTAFNVPIFEKSGYEADDLIGTIAHLKSVDRPDIETIIMTGDQDTLQLVDDNTKVLSPHKGMSETILYDEQAVKEKFDGLAPKQLIDYKALAGDASDNIPGVKGIGPKGAIGLLNEFRTLENIYKNLDDKKIKDRARELLQTCRDDALMSQKLARIILDAPIEFKLNDCRAGGFDKNAIAELFQKLNFKRLLSQLMGLDGKLAEHGRQTGLFDNSAAKAEPMKQKTAGRQDYRLINNEKGAKKFLAELKKQKEFCLDTETTGLDPFRAELLGISFCWQAGEASYLPTAALKIIQTDLQKIFCDQKIKKIGHNLKYDWEILKQSGLPVDGVYFDTMVASYILNPGHRQHGLDTLAFIELGYQMQSIEELIGAGKEKISMAAVPVEKISWYSCEDADISFRLYQKLAKELEKEGMFGLFEKLDMPLVAVLGQMETNGVKINPKPLEKLSREFTKKIASLEQKIYRLAGQKFNVASPLQLKEILFEKMKISKTGLGKTKTGISTAAGELEKLRGQHKIIDLILEFRELSKLKNTYLDALPELINPNDGRVHASFNQTITATGRLSSSEPNLQNIPIRTVTGRQIREAFVAEKGFKIIKADYSQIELRIIASLANDEKMLAAFQNKIDIHTQTAAAINGIKVGEVTPILRRQAKEVNFGVLYGMGAWGLAQRTGIANQQAQEFIDKYFTAYKKVKKYILETVEIARERGYVETFYGRRRYLPEINSGVQPVRSAAERMAVNMPIQGTAADLIKLAMIEIHLGLPKISPRSKMVLQVHDELVFETPEADAPKVAKFIREAMNGAYKLRAPIETEIEVGDNWGETERV